MSIDKNGFDFNFDSDIFSKITGKNQKANNNTSKSTMWNYSSIIEEEDNLKFQRKGKEQDINYKQTPISNTDSNSAIMNPQIKNKIEEESRDKYESELYSKNISFSDFNLSKYLVKSCSDMEYFYPTKVQEKVIPMILKGNDILVNSETGSGKTACFLLPIIQKIFLSKNTAHVQKALILLPTRELVYQCTQMCSMYLKYLPSVTFVSVAGGMSIETQFNALRNNPDIIIATPGRLIDLIYNYKSINLSDISIFVLDEADKLLELGFKDAILEIINLMQHNIVRQTLLFSATLNTKIVDLEKKALKNPLKIKLSHSAVLSNLKQSYVRMKFKTTDDDEEIFEKRMSYLLFLLKNEKKSHSIIFFNTKKDCHKAKIVLDKFNLRSKELNSNIHQTERLKNLNDFQLHNIDFLLATDIAARGIDIEKVRFVINFEYPSEKSKYIHRIGRTARKGYFGEAITICVDNERAQMKKLAKKENFTLNLIKIDNGFVKKFYKELVGCKDEIIKQVEDDEVEMELQEAEKEVEKTMNMTLHRNDILNKPKKYTLT